jgi:predicted alpha/beta-fold hydrolase
MRSVTNGFRPLPLLGNPHLQTVLATLLRPRSFGFPSREVHVALPDGDQIALQDSVAMKWRQGDRIALLVHGLGGSCRSGYMQRVGSVLLTLGWRVVRMDLRGSGCGMAIARRCYHGGLSCDVRAAVEEIRYWSPKSPIALVGFSLGGNIVLKLAGEVIDLAGVDRIAALAPPVDLEKCVALLGTGRNQWYEAYFVRTLMRLAHERTRYFPNPLPVFPPQITMRVFDDLYTAPRWGFEDALDYYRQASCLPVLRRIQVPALIITARDDPFVSSQPLEELAAPAGMKIIVVDHGGHLGFLGWNPRGTVHWAEDRLVDWLNTASNSAAA